MIILIAFITLIAVILIDSWYQSYKLKKLLKNVPGPKPLLILDNTLEYTKTPVLDLHLSWFKKYGNIFQTKSLFRTRKIVTRDLDLIQFILSSSKFLNKGESYKLLHNWLGTGLITSSNPKWKRHRRLLTPSFHFKMLEHFLNIFNSFEHAVISNLEKLVNKGSFDVLPIMSDHALNLICNSAMGSVLDKGNTINQNVNELCRIFMERLTVPFKTPNLTYSFTRDSKIEQVALNTIHKHTDNVILSRKEFLQKDNTLMELSVDEFGTKKKLTFLDTLLQQQIKNGDITDKDIRDEVQSFLLAGYETTAATMSYLLYNLAQNPEVQEKVVEEMRLVFNEDKYRQPTFEDISKLKYFDKVLKESLRLYPVVPMISRFISETVTFGDITIPEGCEIIISIFALHRDPKFYENPEVFDPERFTPENQMKRPLYSYIPFSGGSRNCIGQKYAALEVKTVIANVLRNYEVLPSPNDKGLQIRGDMLLRAINGVPIQLKRRKF